MCGNCVRVDFGAGSSGIICLGPPTLMLDGRPFEFHHFCGPTFLRKDGQPLRRQPGERNPIWKSLTLWIQQGQRVSDEGVALYELREIGAK